jgi:ERI1 exoribonuclease 2
MAAQSERSPLLQGIDQFVFVDFEATCGKGARIYPQEIIEFPAVLVDGATGRPLTEFRTYVRPRHHPRLTAYCTDLTGIRQDQVDAGVELWEALAMHDAWLRRAVGDRSFAVVTWGDWDCRTMLESECRFKGLAKPVYFDRWVNLRVHFDAVFGSGSRPRRNLREARVQWGGCWHCGLNDARNKARLLAELMQRGVTISSTGSLAGALTRRFGDKFA